MFEELHAKRKPQLILGLLIGIGFGFFLQKGGVTSYDVIIGQLLLTNFTVLKLMISAVIIGMIGIHLMKSLGWIEFHTFKGSIGSTAIGGCIFGLGFGILGLCPGTLAGAIGTGQMDALWGGAVGILIGSALFAQYYPAINAKYMDQGVFPAETIPELLSLPRWVVVAGLILVMGIILFVLEFLGL